MSNDVSLSQATLQQLQSEATQMNLSPDELVLKMLRLLKENRKRQERLAWFQQAVAVNEAIADQLGIDQATELASLDEDGDKLNQAVYGRSISEIAKGNG